MEKGDKSEIFLRKKGFNMTIYIGFSTKTHKKLARIFCKGYKHCTPIVINKNKCEIYQFTNIKDINIICITKRDLKILSAYGWVFIKCYAKKVPSKPLKIRAFTCVQFTKKFCGINKVSIQTPDALLKYLIK